MNLKKQTIITIIGGIFIVIAAVIGILWFIYREYEVGIYLRDMDTQSNVSGIINFYDSNKTVRIGADVSPVTVRLRKGLHNVRVESSTYKPKDDVINPLVSPVIIYMEKVNGDELIPLDMTDWEAWHEITLSRGTEDNEVIINSDGKIEDAAGFFHSGLDFLHGKTLILYFSNTAQSSFLDNRLVKLEYSNSNIVRPSNAAIREYLSVRDTPPDKGIEFPMTENFAGRLNFIFYQATLNDLKITAWYK